jgi:hypothetical protein
MENESNILTAELLATDFQTPPPICKYMVSLIPAGVRTVLEPTPGIGNILFHLSEYDVTAPDDFFLMEKQRFDCVVTNPPYSRQYTYGLPEHLDKKGYQVGYHIVKECMEMSDNIIAMLPWFIITNSEKRMKEIKAWGLRSVTVIPRRWFPGSRTSNCILDLTKGYSGMMEFKTFEG